MHRERGEPGDSDAADEFDRIVAAWRREKSVPAWPDDDDEPTAPRPRPTPAPPPPPPTDEDHFVPPEPPPLPKVGPPAIVGLGLLALGLVLVTVPWWVGVPDTYGLPLGLLTLAAGLGWLVLRLWPDPAGGAEGDDDDGAVL